MSETFTLTATVWIPLVPDFLGSANGSGMIPLSAFSDIDLRRVGQLWTEDLLAKAAEQRAEALKSEDP